MMFAVLAARPRREVSKNTLSDFQSGQANLLIFEQFSHLSEREYRIGMRSLLQDNHRIYDSMAGQLYRLGCDADRKFKYLYLSYTTFLIGLAASALSLLLIEFSQPSLA
jgi:hypothetical protein